MIEVICRHAPCRPPAACGHGHRASRAYARTTYVKRTRGPVLTQHEKLDVLLFQATLRSQDLPLSTVDSQVAQPASTLREDCSGPFESSGELTVADTPSGHSAGIPRVLQTTHVLESVRTFNPSRGVLNHLLSTDGIALNATDDTAMAAALRAVQRFVVAQGYCRGIKKNGMLRLKQIVFCGISICVLTLLLRIGEYFMDKSSIHHNHARRDDALKTKTQRKTILFYAAIIDCNHKVPVEQRMDDDKAQLISESLDIFYHKSKPSWDPIRSQKKEVLVGTCLRLGIPGKHQGQVVAEVEAVSCGGGARYYADAGRRVIFTPPHHSDLQPIELVWASVKGEVGRQYTTSTTFADVKGRLINAFANVSESTVQKCIAKAEACAQELEEKVEALKREEADEV
ncbi:TPA: LOW QUALITY PROTEIN: hypothetical protein N0F65_001308 [Lagenidium giganteum]|uniref:Uncharacterized protein n=1 Tax=Lagenidium giganteum TaxID=4803 RepID=A0AAV2Z2G2_9STRA|nr:TPA: LOW QUALITY PROTEIN: hypothetical protein N0F65_001308 [Lagenidium giganteum]